jgi:hypothetical protein
MRAHWWSRGPKGNINGDMPREIGLCILLVSWMVCCGGSVDDAGQGSAGESGTSSPDAGEEEPSTEDGAVYDAAAEVGATDATTADGCPTSPPQGAGDCAAGLICEYGDDPRDYCRVRWSCIEGHWSERHPGCPALQVAACGATRAEVDGQPCTTEGTWCTPEGTACQCTNCDTFHPSMCNGPLTWHCEAATTGCPAGVPNVGTPCSPSAQQCIYRCGADGSRTCAGGSWAAGNGYLCQ